MPRTGRGGSRSGKIGTAYSNRSDLNGAPPQAVKTAPSQQYGQGVKQEAAMRAQPLPNSAAQPSPQQYGQDTVAGSLGAFDRPTERPGEPITEGMSLGAGAGPEVLPMVQDDVGVQLRALYQLHPNQDLRDLIEAFDENREVG